MNTKKIYVQTSIFAILLVLSLANAQNNAEDDFKLARNLFRDAGDYATASKLFGEFILNYPNNPRISQARLLLARSFRNNNKCESAENAYETFILKHPDHLETSDARRERAACLSKRGLFKESAKAYLDIQSRYKASDFAPEALLSAAKNYARAGDSEKTIALLEKLIGLYDGTDSAEEGRYELAVQLIKENKTKEAQSLLKILIHSNQTSKKFVASSLLINGRLALVENNNQKALKNFTELHERFSETPQSDSAYFEFATHLYQKNLFDQAGDSFAIAEEKINITSIKTRSLLGLADSRRKGKKTLEALKHYQKLLSQIEPGHRDYLSGRLGQAIALGEAGEFASAVSLFHAILKIENQNESVIALRELGALYQQRGDFTQALNWFQKYLDKVGDESETTKMVMAKLYTKTGNLEKSISTYRQLSSFEAKIRLAKTLEISGKPQEALNEYVAFLNHFPSSPYAKEAQARIHFLRHFVVLNPQELNRMIQQSWINELNGKSRQSVQFDIAHAFYKHHDFFNASKSFEHFAAAYPKNPQISEVQFFLAESLASLAKQRSIENNRIVSDSLFALATQEFRVLARRGSNDWSQKAQLRLTQLNGGDKPDSLDLEKMEEEFRNFVNENLSNKNPTFELGLILLAETQLKLGPKIKASIDSAFANFTELRQSFPKSLLMPRALFGVGQSLSMRGNINAAIDTLHKFLQLFPKDKKVPSALFEIAQMLSSENQLEDAVSVLQELRWGHPSFSRRHLVMEQLGDIYFDSQQYPAAIELYNSLANQLNDSKLKSYIIRKLARSYHLSGNYTSAQKTYTTLIENASEYASKDSIIFEQAILFLKLGDEENSINTFLSIHEQFPKSTLGKQGLARAGHISFSLKDYNRSITIYESIISSESIYDTLTYGQYAISLFRTENIGAALKATKTFKQRFDSSWQTRFELEAANYYKRNNQYDRALKTYKKVEQAKSPLASEAAYEAVMLVWNRNKMDPSEDGTEKAIKSLNRFVKKYPNSRQIPAIFLHIANYQYSLRRYLQAAGAYKQVLSHPDASSALVQEAIWLLLKSYLAAHEYESAHQVADKILEEFPDHPNLLDVRLELGIILKEKGLYRDAIQHFDSQLNQHVLTANDASEARFYIGQSYQNLGEYRKAIEAYYKVSYHGANGSSQWITSADFQRAKCHESLSEYTTAIVIYDRIIQREGGNSPQGEMANEQVQKLRVVLEKLK